MAESHEIEIRVRYQETDAMGRVHHANFLTYFEMGRTEMLRSTGRSYRALEDEGLFLVVAKMQCRFHRAARYDDLLRIRTTTTGVTRVRLEHAYQVFCGETLLTEGETTLACVDTDGRPSRIPKWFLEPN
jgi:acyl-CoA thioester hydrolase